MTRWTTRVRRVASAHATACRRDAEAAAVSGTLVQVDAATCALTDLAPDALVGTSLAGDEMVVLVRDADAGLHEAERCGGSVARRAAHGGQAPGGGPRASGRVRSAAAGA